MLESSCTSVSSFIIYRHRTTLCQSLTSNLPWKVPLKVSHHFQTYNDAQCFHLINLPQQVVLSSTWMPMIKAWLREERGVGKYCAAWGLQSILHHILWLNIAQSIDAKVLVFFFFFWQVSLWSLGLSGTHYIDKADLEPGDSFCLCLPLMRLQVWSTVPDLESRT